MIYVDFDLRIEKAGENYRVYVLNTLAGEAYGQFSYPSLDRELNQIINRLGHMRNRSRGLESLESKAAREFGTKLFNTVFSGDVRSRFDSARASLNETTGLRLRLNLSNAPELADVPWEFLYDPAGDRFLTLSVETPLVRYLDLPRPVQPLEITPPIKILVMISSPANVVQLDVEGEWQKLKDGVAELEQRGLVSLTRISSSTLPALQRQLRQGRYNIFHFVGHGGYDPKAHDGFLLFETEAGLARSVSGQELGTLLYDSRHSLRLAILNACEGARASGADPFSGTAQSLIQKGIPAVIAMQFEITDRAAIVLAHEFYTAISEGFPVDAALAISRQAIFAQSAEIGTNVEWGTPVLYMRSPDGKIFTIPQAQTVRSPVVEPGEPDTDVQKALESRYSDGLEAYILGDWARAVTAFKVVVDLRPNYKDASARLDESRRQGDLSALNARALSAENSKNWPEAVSALQSLVDKAPDYENARNRLEAAKKQGNLANLYAQAQLLTRSERWEAVVKILDQIRGIDPAYPDPDDLYHAAQKGASAFQQKEALEDLYEQALTAQSASRWEESIQLLGKVRGIQADYRESARLLDLAQKKVVEGQLKQKQAQVAQAYNLALQYVREGKWQPALDKVSEIKHIDEKFNDPEGIAVKARAELEKSAQNARQQEQLKALYAEAARLYSAGEYQAALDKLGEIRSIQPNYPDAQQIDTKSRTELANKIREDSSSQRLDSLYAEAAQLFSSGSYSLAKAKIEEIRKISPEYPDSQGILKAIEAKKVVVAAGKSKVSLGAILFWSIVAGIILLFLMFVLASMYN